MQDQSSIAVTGFPQLKTPQFLEQEQLKCPRCESTNTKFCYYNNYNLSQPRHFCKNCRRYWTKGGALRNIPVGGGSRKNTKRTSSKRSGNGPCPGQVPGQVMGPSPGPVGKVVGGGGVGSFTSLLGLASEGQFGNLFLEGLGQSGLRLGQEGGAGHNPGLKMMQEGNGGEVGSQGLMMMGGGVGGGDHQMDSCWGGGGANSNGWPDLAIYTPGSKFQ